MLDLHGRSSQEQDLQCLIPPTDALEVHLCSSGVFCYLGPKYLWHHL